MVAMNVIEMVLATSIRFRPSTVVTRIVSERTATRQSAANRPSILSS